MRVGCLGMTTIDTLLFTDSVPTSDADLGRISDYVTCLGGKGMVTALSVFHLGCDVVTFTLIGEKNEILNLLPEGFGVDYLQECLFYNNRTWIAVSDNQDVVTFVYPSPVNETRVAYLLDTVSSFIDMVDLLYISTEYLPVLKQAIKTASQARIPIVSNINTPLILDPADHGGKVLQPLLEVSHTIIMNEVEAVQTLTKLNITSWSNVHSPNLREIVITKADKGGMMALKPFTVWERYESKTPFGVKCVVGAGDTFNGAYIKARFVDGLPLTESCEYASEIAGQKVSLKSSAFHNRPIQ